MPALTFRIETLGVGKSVVQMRRIADATERATMRNQHDEAVAVVELARTKYVPIELGRLANSGKVSKTTRRGRRITTIVSFGGDGIDYAIAIHENPSGSTPPSWIGKEINFSPAGTGPKYLERASRERSSGMTRRLGSQIEVSQRSAL